jgi:hypothetical protein
MGGGSSRPRWRPPFIPWYPPPRRYLAPPPPADYDNTILRNNAKQRFITSMRSERDRLLRSVLDSLRNRKVIGDYHKYLSYDGKDYWIYFDVSMVNQNVVLPPQPAFPVQPPPPTDPTTLPPNTIQVHVSINYQGTQSKMVVGSYKNLPSSVDSKIKSLVIPRGRRVIVFEKQNFKGHSKTFVTSSNNLNFVTMFQGTSWANKIRSIKVE